MNKQHQNLIDKLDSLKLSFISENFIQAASHAARKKLDYIAFMENLVDGEVALKQQKSVANRIRKANHAGIRVLVTSDRKREGGPVRTA